MTEEEKEIIREAIPNNSVVFSLNTEKPTSEVKLKSAEWQIIMQIDGERTVQNITERLALSESESLPLFYNLFQRKLIEIKEVPELKVDYVSEQFFTELEKILVKYIGPVASYIIEDVLAELNEEKDRFVRGKIPLLTESISQEIMDDEKRVKFQQEMLARIRNV